MSLRGTSPGMLGRMDALEMAAAHGSSSDAKQLRVKQRVNAYRHALQRLESNSSTSGFKIGSNVESSQATMFSPTITKGMTMEISTSSDSDEDYDSSSDTENGTKKSTVSKISMPKVATRKSLTLVSSGQPMAVNNNWVRLSGSLDIKELEKMRFSQHQRKPLAESRDSLLLDGLLNKNRAERTESEMVRETAATKAKAQEEQDREVVFIPKLSTRRSFSLVTRQDSSRLSLGTGAVVTKTKMKDAVAVAVGVAEPKTYDDDPVFTGYDHEMAEDERSNSYEWEDPMLDQGFDLGLLGLSAPKVAPTPPADVADAVKVDDSLAADVLKGLLCEWDEWWAWYAEAMQYSEAVEALDSIDVPMSVCYVTHVNSYLLEDLDGDMNTRTAWEANARLMGLDDDDCNEEQADAVFTDVDGVDEMSDGRSSSVSSGVRDSIAAAGQRFSHSIGSLKQHVKTDSGVSVLSSTSSTSSGGTRRVRFARRHLSIGFAYSIPDDDDDEGSVDSSDNIGRFYEEDDDQTNPAFLTCIESESEDEESDGEYESESDADSDSESRVDMGEHNKKLDQGNDSDDDGFSDDDDAGDWSDVESDSDAEDGDEELEPVPDVGRSRSMVDRGAIMAMFGAGEDGEAKESSSQSSSQSSLDLTDPASNTVSMPYESEMGMVGATEKDIGMQVKGRRSQVVTKKDFNMSGVAGKGGKRRGSSIASAFARTFSFPRRRSSTRKPSRSTVAA